MQVQIKFDTEKESIDDLKRLISSLQDLVKQRETMPTAQVHVSAPQPVMQQPQAPQQPKPAGGHTSGGGRIMDYDPNIGDLLSKFASGDKY